MWISLTEDIHFVSWRLFFLNDGSLKKEFFLCHFSPISPSFSSVHPPLNPCTSSQRSSHSPSLHNTPSASSCLAVNLTPHFPRSILSSIAPCLRWKVWGLEGWGGEGEESHLESISQLRHQCFAVGTLLIALLYNYSTSTPSFWLSHQSCFQFLSLSAALYPPFACFPFSFFAILFPLSVCVFFQFHTMPVCRIP